MPLYSCLNVRNTDIPGTDGTDQEHRTPTALCPPQGEETKAGNTAGLLTALTPRLERGVGETKKASVSSCKNPKRVNKILQIRWNSKCWQYKYFFLIVLFFSPCLKVFIPPKVSGYFDSFLNYLVVSYCLSRDICIKGGYDPRNYDGSNRPGNRD